MLIIRKVLTVLISLISITFQLHAERKIENFNADWKFYLGDNAQAKGDDFDDHDWRMLNLPHDWSIEQNYTTTNTAGSTAFLPTGIGWYRKTFDIAESLNEKITHIEFDGVFCNAEVWINGELLGRRPYGYIPFGYNLTPYLKQGTNTIAVRVDHSNFADTRWYSGSGIYRPVRLVTTSSTYIPQWGSWIETPQVSQKSAKVKLFTVIKSVERNSKLNIVSIIKDTKGNVIAKQTQKIVSNKQDTVYSLLNVKMPQLWSIETPTLYDAEIQIWHGKTLKDTYAYAFGIRSIRFDANKGFFLNEKNVKIKGVCLHHDAGAVGAVFIKNVWVRRLDRLKDIGVNAIRMAHNPADPGLLQLCDEMGFVVMNEAFDEWRKNKGKWITSRFAKDMRPELEGGYGDIYEEWAEQDTKDMVRYSRQHPSIIMWSMGNEIEWTYPYYWKMEQSNQGLGNQVLVEETGDSIDELKQTAIEIQNWIKEIDQTRFVTSGGVLPKAGNLTGYFDVPDVMGYNYRSECYDEDHANYPERIIYGSENWGTYQEWKDAIDRDFIAGIFLWTGIAYLGESGPYPWKGLEISLLDFAGYYTPRGHFYKTLWSNTPYTYVATKHMKKAEWKLQNGQWIDNRVRHWLDKWLFEDVAETWNYENSDTVFVEVFSNSPEVELFINDKSFGRQKLSAYADNIAKYAVPYTEGELKAVGINNEKQESEYSIKTAKWVSKIVLKADRTSMNANGEDVTHIEAFVTDNAGNIVPDKKMQLVFAVSGEGTNLAVDNGWERNVQPHKSNMIVTHNGKALMLVQSTNKAGSITVSAKAGQLISNEITIRCD